MNPQDFIKQSTDNIQNSKSLDYDLIMSILQNFTEREECSLSTQEEDLTQLLPKIMRQIRKCHEIFTTIKTAMKEMKIDTQKELKKTYGEGKRLYIPSVYVYYLQYNKPEEKNRKLVRLQKILIFGNCNSQDRVNLYLSSDAYYQSKKLNLNDNNYICNNLEEVYELLSYFVPGFHKDPDMPCFGDFEEFYQF